MKSKIGGDLEIEYTRHQGKSNESARRPKEKVLITNSPSEEEISTESKKIDHNSLHAYEHMITQNYDRRIGTTENEISEREISTHANILTRSINRQYTRIP